ncbi:MAG: general secretion pathway protein GspC [Deltaproteobacteria bacterium]|nr:MAG: general secretion pathway protein GspC [Deltaproteobacteria bacterium]
MKDYIKNYFWLLNLLFLLLGAWLLAGTVNAVIAHKLRPLPTVPAKSSPARRPATNLEQEDNQVVVERNLFNSALAQPQEPVQDIEEQVEDPGQLGDQGQPSDIRASLVGTVVASDPRWSMAMITDLTASETGIYRIGDDLLDEAKVVAVLSRRVVIRRGGSLEYLELQEKASPKHPGIRKSPRPGRSASSSLGKGIKKTGPNSWSIERGEIENALSNLNNIAMQARIVPSFKNGQANGFKLFAIRPGSLYSKLGIQNGDIIHKINGFIINSPDKALEIYQKLKNARQVEIELTRRGQHKKLNYSID